MGRSVVSLEFLLSQKHSLKEWRDKRKERHWKRMVHIWGNAERQTATLDTNQRFFGGWDIWAKNLISVWPCKEQQRLELEKYFWNWKSLHIMRLLGSIDQSIYLYNTIHYINMVASSIHHRKTPEINGVNNRSRRKSPQTIAGKLFINKLWFPQAAWFS